MDNILNARIKLKYDLLTTWNASTFIPLSGEVCIAYIESNGAIAGGGDGTQTHQPRAIGIKVGDGAHKFSELPWIQAVAADVYAWAKASTKPGYNATEIAATTSGGDTNATTVQAILSSLENTVSTLVGSSGGTSIAGQIASAINALDGVITGTPGSSKTLTVFQQEDGVITATFADIQIAESQVTSANGGWITDGLAAKAPLASPTFTGTVTLPSTTPTQDTQATTKKYVDDTVASATAGLSGAMHYKGAVDANPTSTAPSGTYAAGDVVTNGNKEFVYDGTNWRELGDEGSYALKTITVTGSDGLTGGGALTENRTISHATPTGASAGTLGTAGGRQYIQTLTTDKFGHVIGAAYATETVADNNTTYTFAQGDNDGEIKVTATPYVNGVAGTAVNSSVKPKNLKTVATTGSAYDLNEVNGTSTKYFIFDCGSATVLIDAASNSQT